MSDPHHPEPAKTDPNAPVDPHAPPANLHEIEHHIAFYWKVGGILLFFTLFTVFLSYVDLNKLFKNGNMVIGMIVAAFKVSLVGAIFMHLKEEKSTIWRFLYFTAFFVTGLFLLFALAFSDPIFGTRHWTH